MQAVGNKISSGPCGVQARAAVFQMNSEAGFVQWLKGAGLLSDLSHRFLIRKCAPWASPTFSTMCENKFCHSRLALQG